MTLFAMIASNCRTPGKPDAEAVSEPGPAAPAVASTKSTAHRPVAPSRPTVILMRQGH